jgi:hypothetical protein
MLNQCKREVTIRFMTVDEYTYFAWNDVRGDVSFDAGYDSAESGSRDGECDKTRDGELHDSGKELKFV